MKAPADRASAPAWSPPKIAAGFDGGVTGGTLSSRVARAVARALKGLDRTDVAARMSAVLQERVSRAMLDAYASEARTTHRITVERLIALIEVTNCVDLIGFIAEPFAHVVIPADYAGIIELYHLEEHERRLAARKAELIARRPRS